MDIPAVVQWPAPSAVRRISLHRFASKRVMSIAVMSARKPCRRPDPRRIRSSACSYVVRASRAKSFQASERSEAAGSGCVLSAQRRVDCPRWLPVPTPRAAAARKSACSASVRNFRENWSASSRRTRSFSASRTMIRIRDSASRPPGKSHEPYRSRRRRPATGEHLQHLARSQSADRLRLPHRLPQCWRFEQRDSSVLAHFRASRCGKDCFLTEPDFLPPYPSP